MGAEVLQKISSRKHMMDSFEKGHTVIQENYPVYSTENHRPQLYCVTAEMVRNAFSVR